jgi:hypothetical protein
VPPRRRRGGGSLKDVIVIAPPPGDQSPGYEGTEKPAEAGSGARFGIV